MRKSLLAFLFVTIFCPLFSEAAKEKIVAEISQICNPGGDPEVWVFSGNAAPAKARDFMGLRAGDRVELKEKSKAVVLIRYGLPTELPLLISRICGKAPSCGPENIHQRKLNIQCLTTQVPFYQIIEPAADTPFLKKVAQLFTDMFYHMGKSEYDFSVTPYSEHRPGDKKSVPFEPIAPSGCPILNNQPVFYWTGPASQTYTVEVFEKGSGKKVWNSAEVDDLTLSYSGDALSTGVYSWHLVSNKQQSEDATFEILSEEKRVPTQELLKSFDDPLFEDYPVEELVLLKVSVLIDEQLYADALPLLLGLSSKHPGVPAMLKIVYEKQGRPDLIRKEE